MTSISSKSSLGSNNVARYRVHTPKARYKASAYSTVAMTIPIGISYSLSIVMLGLLVQRFYLRFKSNKNTIVLLYGLSSSILAVNSTLTFAFVGKR